MNTVRDPSVGGWGWNSATSVIGADSGIARTLGDRALRCAAALWLFTALCGQWAFSY